MDTGTLSERDAIMLKPCERIKDLKKLLDITELVSQIDNKFASSIRTLEAQKIYEKISLHAHSFYKLWPTDNESIKLLDASSLASIARNIFEATKVYNYLCERGISEEEFELRLHTMFMHDSMGREKILRKFGFTYHDDNIQVNSITSTYAQGILEQNSLFNNLDEKLKNKILKGEKAYLHDRVSKSRTLFTKEFESGIYNLLSNSVHSYPLGLNNYSGGLSEGFHLGMYHLIVIAIEVSVINLASVLDAYLGLRKYKSLLDKECLLFIKSLISTKNFMLWLEGRKLKGLDGFFSVNLGSS
ncbi:hypothetical protein H0178_28630 [Cytobacillus firmus]|uniref:hypothetical protein n=1 Tax=Paenibacillus lautus TaxID=1401 RepID=UPI00384D0A09|nr:hypothetical protein [Cytobacillus firmus]